MIPRCEFLSDELYIKHLESCIETYETSELLELSKLRKENKILHKALDVVECYSDEFNKERAVELATWEIKNKRKL